MARPGVWFRNTIGLFAGVLTLQAAWLLVTEFIRPGLPYFPQPTATEEASAGSRAEMAASIGWLRGELWTDAAIAGSSRVVYLPPTEVDHQESAMKDRAGAIA